jgi:acyl-CoA hydrolase
MARMVILEVNPAMPRTRGATSLPARRVNATVEHVAELPHLSPSMPDDVDRQVAEHVAGLVPDGATIQLGIGAVPDAVGHFLRKKKHLGVHTELVSDAIVDLVESGAVDGSRKSVWPGLVVGAFVLGGQRLYDFVNANAGVELHPASFVNDPWVVGQNTLMHSINTCVEMDLTGQVCSESIGHSEISGVGGAADTHVGAQRSRGGRGILAFRSLSARGDSKIVFELRPGAKVSIGRNDVDTIVTEWGVAELRGRSVAERVMALVRVAHPEFREGLWEKARAAGYLPRGTEGRFVPRT